MTTTARPETTTTVLIPENLALVPRATRHALLRSLSAYAVLWAAGLGLALIGHATAQELGAGLALPGGGLIATGHPLWGATALALTLLAVFTWWAAGPTVLPPIAWALTAALPVALVDNPTTTHAGLVTAFAVVPALSLVAFALHVARHRSQSRTGARLNEQLRATPFVITGPPDLATGYPVVEHSDTDLRRLRAALDTALQPLDGYDGFTQLDQFREGALRYQLNALSYGLSMSQFTRTPAFQGYLAEAQRNTIEKVLDRRIWGYWALENAWGNLSLDKDPIPLGGNIMLTGFFGLQVGMYTTLNDGRYMQPGSLTFRWDDATAYPYDLPALAANVRENVRRSPFALYPCEPNWIYSVCNTFGLNTVLTQEHLAPSGEADAVRDRLRASYESEFLRPDGRIVGVRSSHLGLSWNFWASPAVGMTTTYWLHPGLPDLAQRSWWLVRNGWLRVADGLVETPRGVVSRLDPGSYKLGADTFPLAVATMAAREVGDEEVATAAEATLAERPVEASGGAERVAGASGLANSYLNLGRFGRRSGLRDLVTYGPPPAWRTGPILEDAAYPEVLVARAVTDGTALDLVLVPGDGAVRTTIALARLRPGVTYRVSDGREVVAGTDGRALLEVDLGRRTTLRIHP